ncbi:lymphocyte function-associated antigen 3-like isoform X2 [Enoplosus armatus]|uniref:lymphocyte function-associated antigen 3-like isoform X2 n=1 Tax=Enoplosus armatus TaxID=215367 RepID=UPI0039951081
MRRGCGRLATFFTVLLSWMTVLAKSDKPVYKAVGDHVVFTPDSVVHPITYITWKHEHDIAVEWDGTDVNYYRHFKVRGMLNTSTGTLEITELTLSDSGNYTAEINQQDTDMTQLLVISPVPKPSVSTWCDLEMTYCILTCEGNTTHAEPVTYKWGASDMVFSPSGVFNITKEKKEPSFTCSVRNPVSSKSSEQVLNPFTTRNRRWMLTCLIPLVGGIVSILFFIYKHKCRKAMLPDVQEIQDLTSVEPTEPNNVTERSAMLPDVQEIQDLTSVEPTEPNNVTERSAMLPDVQEIQDLTSVEPTEPNNVTAGNPAATSSCQKTSIQESQEQEPDCSTCL